MKLKSLTGGVLLALLCACGGLNKGAREGICAWTSEASHVCEVPFEHLLVDREYLIGRNVRIDGFLLIEKDESGAEVLALFSSLERARLCREIYAVRLRSSSREMLEELRSLTGLYVTLAGRVSVHPSDPFIATINVVSLPTMISADHHEVTCQRPPQSPTDS